MRLYYNDVGLNSADTCGHEEMKFSEKQIYSYNMRDGDEIYIYLKGKSIANHISRNNDGGCETISDEHCTELH